MKLPLVPVLSLFFVLILIISACEGDPETGCIDSTAPNYSPTAQVDDGSCLAPAVCWVDETAEVRFTNNSTTNSTHDILWDGTIIATVAPGDTTEFFTVDANIVYFLRFQFTNTGDRACDGFPVFFLKCRSAIFSCDG